MSLRVAKVPGSKWRLADWYVAHLPATRVYLEPYFGSGAVLFNKPRSPTEVVNDIDGRVVALFRCLRDRPDDLARVVSLTPWARDEWMRARSAPDADDELELARQFLVASHQSHGHRSLSRSGWRAYNACSSASSTKSVCIELLTRQPTMRRAKTSITKATYSQPCQVET